jgi:hypothetical protein
MFMQIGIDAAIIVVFILLIRKLKIFKRDPSLNQGLKIFESLLTDADNTAIQFKAQLAEKNLLINKLNKELDKKILSINVLLNRADALLSNQIQTGDAGEPPVLSSSQEKEIIELAQKGHNLESIADTLSIPKGEVMLVLNLKQKVTQAPQD